MWAGNPELEINIYRRQIDTAPNVTPPGCNGCSASTVMFYLGGSSGSFKKGCYWAEKLKGQTEIMSRLTKQSRENPARFGPADLSLAASRNEIIFQAKKTGCTASESTPIYEEVLFHDKLAKSMGISLPPPPVIVQTTAPKIGSSFDERTDIV